MAGKIQWTQSQQSAISARGSSVGVSGGGGGGKTAFLTKRII